MNLKQLRQVMQKYGRAWEMQDSELILDCFTKDGIYQESPLAKPYRGYKEIKSFWDKVVKKETRDIHFKLKKCYLSRDRKIGFAEWECKNRHGREKHYMAGIMLIQMKGGKISSLNEYWNTRIERLDSQRRGR